MSAREQVEIFGQNCTRLCVKYKYWVGMTVLIIIAIALGCVLYERLEKEKPTVSSRLTIVTVATCGSGEIEETIVMFKSALLFAREPPFFVVLADEYMIPSLNAKFTEWKQTSNHLFDFSVRPAVYPPNVDAALWETLSCSALRLFLPDVLEDIDSVIYVDPLVQFLARADIPWGMFHCFNSSQFAALANDCGDPEDCSYQPRFVKHPYGGQYGLHAGVMLLNLTRMREARWSDQLEPIYKKWNDDLEMREQDIFNVMFGEHPEFLYVMDCRFNFRADYCMFDRTTCLSVAHGSIAFPLDEEYTRYAFNGTPVIIHGYGNVFHDERQVAFRVAYEVMRDFRFSLDPLEHVYERFHAQVSRKISESNGKGCNRQKFVHRFSTAYSLNFLGENYLSDKFHAYDFKCGD